MALENFRRNWKIDIERKIVIFHKAFNKSHVNLEKWAYRKRRNKSFCNLNLPVLCCLLRALSTLIKASAWYLWSWKISVNEMGFWQILLKIKRFPILRSINTEATNFQVRLQFIITKWKVSVFGAFWSVFSRIWTEYVEIRSSFQKLLHCCYIYLHLFGVTYLKTRKWQIQRPVIQRRMVFCTLNFQTWKFFD